MAFRPPEDFKPFYRRNDSSMPRKRKQKVLQRDNYTCTHCGAGNVTTVDHIIPYSKGGSNKQSNLQAMCYDCNQEKGDKIL